MSLEADDLAAPAPPGFAPNLEILMRRYQQADLRAATALIAEVSPLLLRFFAGQMGNRFEAEDMFQDAWIRVHRARHTYRPGEPVLPWLYAIARHVRVDRYRQWRRRSALETAMDGLPEKTAASAPASTLPDFETMVAVLPAAQREVVTLLKVSGLSLDEVARATHSTVGAVKQKAHRAYQRLRTLLDSPIRGAGSVGGVKP